jgi:RNA polymerase subunit RPABC4/transcription elongation factor Spt4
VEKVLKLYNCPKCGDVTTNSITHICDTCKIKELVRKWGSKDYKVITKMPCYKDKNERKKNK